MMDFEGRDELMQIISRNGTMQRELALYQQYALAMTGKYEPEMAPALMAGITGDKRLAMPTGAAGMSLSPIDRKRAAAASRAQPGGAAL